MVAQPVVDDGVGRPAEGDDQELLADVRKATDQTAEGDGRRLAGYRALCLVQLLEQRRESRLSWSIQSGFLQCTYSVLGLERLIEEQLALRVLIKWLMKGCSNVSKHGPVTAKDSFSRILQRGGGREADCMLRNTRELGIRKHDCSSMIFAILMNDGHED